MKTRVSDRPTPTVREQIATSRSAEPVPQMAILSNGRYGVLITDAGAGYGIWRGLDVTRWREDATRDCWGQFCYFRDLHDNQTWSIGRQPSLHAVGIYDHAFFGDR